MANLVLVTGGAGFIGSNIVAALSERGEKIVICDWLESGDKWKNIAKSTICDFVDPDDLEGWLHKNDSRFRAIIHMGAISATTETNGDLILKRNFAPTRMLWRFATDNAIPFIYASSAATYGDGSAGLKFFNVYGPNEYHKGNMKSVIAQCYPKVMSGEAVTLFKSHNPDYEDGGQLRDFVYVQDCVNVILWLLDKPEVSGLFNLGTGKARSFKDLAAAVFAAANKPAGFGGNFRSLEDGITDYVTNYLAKDDIYR